MLIGFNLAPVVAGIYWPQDQWIALATATFVIIAAVLFRGFWSRHRDFLGPCPSATCSLTSRPRLRFDHAPDGTGEVSTHDRINLDGVKDADWVGLPPRRSSGRRGRRRHSRLPRADVLADVHPARAARRHRADRRRTPVTSRRSPR
jgi:hypothetical protein